MTSLGARLLTLLGDSDVTAKFQRICGIRSHEDIVLKCNGANGIYDNNGLIINNHVIDSSVCGAGSFNGASNSINATSCTTNGHVNGCDSSFKRGMNGHLDHPRNGVKHSKRIISSNGFIKERNNVPHENGHTKIINCINNDSLTSERLTQETLDNFGAYKDFKQDNGHNDKLQTKEFVDQKRCGYLPKYTIENIFIYYIFSFGASLGNEIFYILFFSSTLWNFDSYVIRKMLIFWTVTMYAGQAAKDIIRWPRPKSPPVVRLEQRYELEYGMPSTHAMVGVAIPFGMLINMSGRYEFNLALGLLLAVTWSIVISISRLYLGMHSALDIIAGLLFAIILMTVTYPFVDPVEKYLISHPSALPVMIAVCITLCLLYPSIDKWSTARGDTTLVLAVFSGIYAGMWLTGKLTELEPLPDMPPYSLGIPSARTAGLILLRQFLGVVIIFAVLVILKMAVLHTLCWFYGLDPKDPKTKQHLVIELPYRFVCYFIAGTMSTYHIPLLFRSLSIDRPSYYSEIINPMHVS